jgi:hypothetical protein
MHTGNTKSETTVISGYCQSSNVTIPKSVTESLISDAMEFYLKHNLGAMKFGICHDTRLGKQQEWFRKCLGVEVIGMEISSTATTFPNIIQLDFHGVKPE